MSKTALIDADSLIFINCHNKKDQPIKTLQDCKDSLDGMIKTILIQSKADSYLLFLTVGKSFRKDYYPEYKANRKYADKPEHFDRVKEYLITDYKAIYQDKLEADDLVNIYRNKIKGSFICSPDGDLLSLEGKHYNYKIHKWIKTSKEDAEYKFWGDMIAGQPGDNIKGLVGKGPSYFKGLVDNNLGNMNCGIELYTLVFDSYILNLGESKGIDEFYKNYKCLKILDEYKGLEIMEPIKFNMDELQEGSN